MSYFLSKQIGYNIKMKILREKIKKTQRQYKKTLSKTRIKGGDINSLTALTIE